MPVSIQHLALPAPSAEAHVCVRGPDDYTHVRTTTAGRKLVRSWTGQKAYKAAPPGTLNEWHWHALARACATGDNGLEDCGHIGWGTWLPLREYKWGALICEHMWEPLRDRRLIIPAAGRAQYERDWHRNRELYPDVDVPELHALVV